MQVRRERDALVFQVDHSHAGQECQSVLMTLLRLRDKEATGAIAQSKVRIGKKVAQLGDVLRAGDTVRAFVVGGPQAEGMTSSEPEAMIESLDVLYEDEHVLVVNKRAGLIMYPGEEHATPTLAHVVAGHYAVTGQDVYVRAVHRLDRDTTGACVYAKHLIALRILSGQLESRRLQREYLALVRGTPSVQRGVIDKELGRDRHVAGRMRVHPGGQRAVTEYTTLWTNGRFSLLLCNLLTGRMHQIRVHLASVGLPILGDSLYGAPSPVIGRQALHALRVRFDDVFTEETLFVGAAVPNDLRNAAADIGLSLDDVGILKETV